MNATSKPVVRVGMRTPWGKADSARELAPGIGLVDTPSHGGIKLNRKRQAALPLEARREGGWYEEDADASIPLCAFYDEVVAGMLASGCRNFTKEACVESLARWNYDALTALVAVGRATIHPAAQAILRRAGHDHEPKAVVSSCDGDGTPCPIEGCDGCPGCDGGWLVAFCCQDHAERIGGVGGAKIDYPDGEPFSHPVGPSYKDVAAELREAGFDVQEGA